MKSRRSIDGFEMVGDMAWKLSTKHKCLR